MSRKNDLKKVFDSVPKESAFSFAKHTTYGCGGSAKTAYYPKTLRQAAAVYDYLKQSGTKYITVGNGSNILAADGAFNGEVIVTKKLRKIKRASGTSFWCYAGATVTDILKFCKEHGFGGLEYLAGIPATSGGLVYMNGGAGGKYIGENVRSVLIYDGEFRILTNRSCHFGNKHSIMRDIDCLILAAELTFTPKSSQEIASEVDCYLKKRSLQPRGRSCGCVFKNSGEISAGKLIDEAGLKGLSIGGATVSRDHANFIINSGTRSSDVYKLIKEVKRIVLEKTGILLVEEVVYIGDFNDTFS